ncbi:glycosyltransferase family 2 protein [Methanobrevibacter sp.]|uniref:glycosyltransferase family 2 protein n=1 Tax=Methanobrevibacter sp. TaxID=66852 RepID=UPI00388E3618
MVFLSIVVPCYNEEESVNLFVDEIERTLPDLDYEIIYINDGSSDNTLLNIKKIAESNPKVKYISFSRNFGKESAMYAGLKSARGDYICVMDVDLQHPPSLLPEMIGAVTVENYDVAAARRVSRAGEPKIKSFFSHLFYKMFNAVSNMQLVEGATDYRVMRRMVVDSILELSEYNRFSKGIFEWVGFDTKWIAYENIERTVGETTWSFWGLIHYSIEGIVAFTTTPLSISIVLGSVFSTASFLYMIFVILKYILYSDPIQGYTTLITSILFLGGLQLVSIGILSKYLEKTYLETKNRPVFIVKETNVDDKK